MGCEAFETVTDDHHPEVVGHQFCLGKKNPWDSAAAGVAWKMELAARKRRACLHQWKAK